MLVVVAGAVGLADRDDALSASTLIVTLAVSQTVGTRSHQTCQGIRLGFAQGVVSIGQQLSHELVSCSFCGLPTGRIIISVASILIGLRVPFSIGIKSRRSGEAQDAQLEAQRSGACHTTVVNGAYRPRKVRSSFVTKIHDEIDSLRKCVARIDHFLGRIYCVIQDWDAAHVTEHVRVGDGHADLGFSLLLRKESRVGIRNAVSILQEQPGVADHMVILLAAEAVVLTAGIGTGQVGRKTAGII